MLTTVQADVLVTSAGYGTIQHSLRHGVPMLTMGVDTDRPTTGMIVDEKEVGIYLYVQALTPEQARENIDQLLTDPKYTANAQKMKESYKNYNPVEKLDEIIRREVKKFDDISMGKAAAPTGP